MKNSNKRRVVRLVVLSAAVTAFATSAFATDNQYFDRMDKITSGAGNAPAHNIAVQTIDPWPRYVHKDRISIDGARIGVGHRRYQANKSIPPRGFATSGVLNTSSAGGGDAGSGGSAGGASNPPAGDGK